MNCSGELHARIAGLLRSEEAASRVISAANRLVQTYGPPPTWRSSIDGESAKASPLLRAARSLRDCLNEYDSEQWTQQLRVQAGTLPALRLLLDDVISAADRRKGRLANWAGGRAIPKGVEAFHALLVEMLEHEGVPRATGSRSILVLAVDLITAKHGIKTSVREYLRADRPCGPLMPVLLARSFLNSKASPDDFLPAPVPGRMEDLRAPNPIAAAAATH